MVKLPNNFFAVFWASAYRTLWTVNTPNNLCPVLEGGLVELFEYSNSQVSSLQFVGEEFVFWGGLPNS